jgi:DNA repair protein RecN (Recombination protein N)
MLELLKIKNIAIIDSAEVQFKQGLNIISGETGAGKSIIIEAISLLLGSRASTELIRAECDEAVIEGLFDISGIPWMNSRLKHYGFDPNTSELLVKRTVHKAGRHRISINGELANLAVLQGLCEGLIDLCGQHEHQSLLRPLTQLELLDRYGGLTEQSKAVTSALQEVRALRKEYERLQKEDHERAKRTDFLKFQIDEIQEAQIVLSEDEQLQREKQLLQSAEARAQSAESVRQILETEETGVLHSLQIALQKVRTLQNLDQDTHLIAEALERAYLETEEASLLINRYLMGIELDTEKLQNIQDRLSLLADLKRKYGGSISQVLETVSQLQKEHFALSNLNDRLNQLLSEINSHETALKKQAQKLANSRRKVSELLANSVTQELKDLKMGEAHFSIELTFKEDLSEWNAWGGDFIQFVVRTNLGEPARPLGKIASGGELSRLMLSIRRVISDRGGIGVYLFDEIDAGIGGQTAFQVGKKLKSVASYNQVICITHLPQVASFADHHWIVKKSTRNKRTSTEIISLTHNERKEELARMLGGPQLTQRSLENASELLELANP